MKANLIYSAPLAAFILLAGTSAASAASWASGTPTAYKITFQKIEFGSGGSWATFASGNFTWDLACGGQANCDVGSIPPASQLPPGNYTQMRVTFSRTLKLKGSVAASAPDGLTAACYTIAGGATTSPGGAYPNNVTAGQTVAAPAEESVPIPYNNAISTTLTTNNITEIGGQTGTALQLVTSIPSFTIVAGNPSPPNLSVRFDVTNALGAVDNGGGGCYIFPTPPTVHIVNQ